MLNKGGQQTRWDSSSDLQLITNSAGKSRAFDDLVRRYQDRLVHSLEHVLNSREDALDVLNRRLFWPGQKLSSFREMPVLFVLYRIARNVCDQPCSTSAAQFRPVLDHMHEASASSPRTPSQQNAPGHAMEQAEQVRLVSGCVKKNR